MVISAHIPSLFWGCDGCVSLVEISTGFVGIDDNRWLLRVEGAFVIDAPICWVSAVKKDPLVRRPAVPSTTLDFCAAYRHGIRGYVSDQRFTLAEWRACSFFSLSNTRSRCSRPIPSFARPRFAQTAAAWAAQ